MGTRSGALARTTGLATAAAAWIVAVACSSEYSGPHGSECSNGPAYDVRNYPPPAPSSEVRGIPECVPRCGASQKYLNPTFGQPIYSLSALPSGACANDDERCVMTAGSIKVCVDETRPCDLSAFECECTGGAWRCYVTSQGAGACGPCPEERDASSD